MNDNANYQDQMTSENFSGDNREVAIRMHPQKLAMCISMLSMTMFFVALTSALLFKKGQDWFSFAPPALFYYSPILVVLNSFLLHRATKLYKSAQFKSFRNHLLLALLSAIGFFLVQWFTWKGILDMRLDRRVVSAAFFYVIMLMHALHLLGGVSALLVVWFKAWRSRKDELFELRNIINPKRVLAIEVLTLFWHFVDGLWIYLFLFIFFNYT